MNLNDQKAQIASVPPKSEHINANFNLQTPFCIHNNRPQTFEFLLQIYTQKTTTNAKTKITNTEMEDHIGEKKLNTDSQKNEQKMD